MALTNKKEELDKKDPKEQILLTEAEFEKKQRIKTKEKINRVTRVFGLLAILLLVYVGVYDPLFELSFFGFLFNRGAFTNGWEFLKEAHIFDDPMIFGAWLPQVGVTALLILVTILMVYFLTYTIVDFVDLIRNFIEAGRDITKDLSGNVRDTMSDESKERLAKAKAKGTNVKKPVAKEEKKEEVEKKERKPRRSEKDLNGLTGEQLDALLSGKPMEEVLGSTEPEPLPAIELDVNGEKKLFD